MTNNRRDRTRMPSSEETAEQPRVIGVHGAVEQHVNATRALSEALTGAENAGAAIDLLDLSALTLPLYNPDHQEVRDVAVVKRSVSRADAVLLVTAARHGSYSAQLKTALEYCSPDGFADKPVGLLGVAAGSSPATAVEHLRTVCETLDARVLALQVSLASAAVWEHDELPIDCVTELRMLGEQVVDRISHSGEERDADG